MIKVTREIEIRDFEFWGGAVEVAAQLTQEQWDRLEDCIFEFFPNGIDEVVLNDLVWFDWDELWSDSSTETE